MNEEKRYTRYAEMKAGRHNKFYEVEAIREEGATHVDYYFRWGRIGTTGTEKHQTSLSWSVAVDDCDEQFEKKLGKGYKEVTAMQALASAVEDPTERRSEGGLPPVDIPFGSRNDRVRRFFSKYLDKLNVLRDSRGILGYIGYKNQYFDLLLQYDDEWARICKTKAHRYLWEDRDALIAVRDFRGAIVKASNINATSDQFA